MYLVARCSVARPRVPFAALNLEENMENKCVLGVNNCGVAACSKLICALPECLASLKRGQKQIGLARRAVGSVCLPW